MPELLFHSDLGVFPSIIVDGTPKEYKIPFVVDHKKVEEVKVTLSGDAPEVNKRKETVTLLNITQKIKDEEDSVIDIKRDVSSEIIYYRRCGRDCNCSICIVTSTKAKETGSLLSKLSKHGCRDSQEV